MSTFRPDPDDRLIVPPGEPWQRRWLDRRRALVLALVLFFCLFDTIGLVLLTAPRPSTTSLSLAPLRRTPTLAADAPVPAASTATALASPTPSPLPLPSGLYVTGIETDPASPRRGQNLTFHVHVLDTGGPLPSYHWAVYVFRAGDPRHALGETPVGMTNIPGGASIIAPAGTWKLTVSGPCQDVIVQVGRVDGPGLITWLIRPDGGIFQQPLTLCP